CRDVVPPRGGRVPMTRAGWRPRGLDVLTAARSLDVLPRPRSLNVLPATRSLDVLTRPWGLDVLAGARSLNVLARARERARRLDVLAAARRLNVLAGARGLNVLARARERARRLDILSLRDLLQHRLSLAHLDRALGLRVDDRRHGRDDCHTHDCRQQSLHLSFHFLSIGLDWFDLVPATRVLRCHPLGIEVHTASTTLAGDEEQPECQPRTRLKDE